VAVSSAEAVVHKAAALATAAAAASACVLMEEPDVDWVSY